MDSGKQRSMNQRKINYIRHQEEQLRISILKLEDLTFRIENIDYESIKELKKIREQTIKHIDHIKFKIKFCQRYLVIC